jgi:ATP adenylyltransferase
MQPENLWAPWRMAYIKQLEAPGPSPVPNSNSAPACFLCEAAATEPGTPDAARRLVVHRDPRGLILLNRYPYTSGHLLVTVSAHAANLSDLTPEQRAGLMELTVLGEQLLRLAVNPQGLNVGINLGRCAGAGLPGHLHVHLVPRWNGDTNFMQAVGNVRVIPQALEESYRAMCEAMTNIEGSGFGVQGSGQEGAAS